MLFEILATTAAGIFAGAAVYISIVEHPARVSCGVELAVTEWRPSYKLGTRMQVPLALIGSASAFTSWWLSRDWRWLVGGLLLLMVVPFTLLVILPTNKGLEAEDLDLRGDRARLLIRRWGRLHALRGILSVIGFTLFILALAGSH